MSTAVYILSTLMIFGQHASESTSYYTSKEQCEKKRDIYQACVTENKSIDSNFWTGSICMLDTKGEYKILKNCELVESK